MHLSVAEKENDQMEFEMYINGRPIDLLTVLTEAGKRDPNFKAILLTVASALREEPMPVKMEVVDESEEE